MPRILVVVPTDFERRILAPRLGDPGPSVSVDLCGFGLVAAGARSANLIARHRPDEVVLVGIAGRLDDRLALGDAACFDAVACHGIGVGSGAGFVPASTLGWPQWSGDPPEPGDAIGDLLPCPPPADGSIPRAPLLLSVTSASADPDDARVRRDRHPEAVAEDMEGFAVALACRLTGVPCRIVRGISNTVGDRDKSRWRTQAALEAAADVTIRLLASLRPAPLR